MTVDPAALAEMMGRQWWACGDCGCVTIRCHADEDAQFVCVCGEVMRQQTAEAVMAFYAFVAASQVTEDVAAGRML